VPLALLATALVGLYAAGAAKAPAVAALALTSLAYGALPPTIAHLALRAAPGSTDIASAGVSMGFNVGIAGGSLLGAALIDGTGVRGVALAGGLLAGAALVVALTDIRPAGRRERRSAATDLTPGNSGVAAGHRPPGGAASPAARRAPAGTVDPGPGGKGGVGV
jgi:hypothetical protein